MNKDLYSNKEFQNIRERLNKELKRRSTFNWWDPLSTPTVGTDKSSPLSIPEGDIQVTDKTYTINTPSEGSIEPTRNIRYRAHGDNPAPQETSSADQLNLDEIKNFLVGLAKINDINLYYGRDEVNYLSFRDTKGIEDALVSAENDELHAYLRESDISPTKNDPNGGNREFINTEYPTDYSVTYPMENGKYVMPSGEYDGEELNSNEGLGPNNFFDDYGAEPGDGQYHPFNRYSVPYINKDHIFHDDDRNIIKDKIRIGGIPSSRFGPNPRNPKQGNPLPSRPVFGGKKGSCNSQCTGLCYTTCDDICSESCTQTCWNRCGNACTSSCSNSCTGCSSQCYNSCKTKCENNTGYACVKSGAKAIKITTEGGYQGKPATNKIEIRTHTCTGCSYSCQFYPNKKTECWDAGCMGKCFTSCDTACSTSCLGGCIDNNAESPDNKNPYKSGKGRGCSSNCTINCVGICQGICAGYCVQTCYHACKQQCSDNCFKAGTLIETIDGPVPIEQLKVGDMVLTQSGEYHAITHVHRRRASVDETFKIIATGTLPLYTTKNHPFWIKRYKGMKRISRTETIQNYFDPEWISANNISTKDRLCFLTFKPGNISINYGIAYMVGRWLGAGWRFDEISKYTNNISSRFGICCGYHEEDDFDLKIKQCGVIFTKSYQDTIIRYDILRKSNPELISILKKCGKGAKGKFIPKEFFDWDEVSLKYLLQGYIDSDGCIDKNGGIHLTTVSKKLAYGIVNIFRCLGINPSWNITTYDKNKNYFIEGRKVNRSDSYDIQTNYFNNSSNISSKYDENDHHIWGTIKVHKPVGIVYSVYNISVEKDPTYYADGVLVHNCSYECSTSCGSGCTTGCDKGCTGCSGECSGSCKDKADSRECVGCGSVGGCTSNCKYDCNKNCMNKGCRNICGTDGASACESNCRLSCMGTSCTAMCSDACSGQCSTCVNTCGMNCGACTSSCSHGCSEECNIYCTQSCANNCSDNCVMSCSEQCGGCSGLCFSCTGMCIGVCSLRCENGCSSCANMCGWWCDQSCSRECMGSCVQMCLDTCTGSCIGNLTSNTKNTEGPMRDPIAHGYIYPHPSNRWEERESFKLIRDITPFLKMNSIMDKYSVMITIMKTKSIIIMEGSFENVHTEVQFVKKHTNSSITTNIQEIQLNDSITVWRNNSGEWNERKSGRVYRNEFIYLWDTNILGQFDNDRLPMYLTMNRSVIIIGPDDLGWEVRQTPNVGGVYQVDPETGDIVINEDAVNSIPDIDFIDLDNKDTIFIITLKGEGLNDDNVYVKLPFEFDVLKTYYNRNNEFTLLIERKEWL